MEILNCDEKKKTARALCQTKNVYDRESTIKQIVYFLWSLIKVERTENQRLHLKQIRVHEFK